MKHTPIIDRVRGRGLDGTQQIYRFDNGYGASVVRGFGTYGFEDDLFELGVIRFKGDDWKLDYTTPITSDVEGYLTPEAVDDLLDKIAALPPAESDR